jgi:hypothetical protein
MTARRSIETPATTTNGHDDGALIMGTEATNCVTVMSTGDDTTAPDTALVYGRT